MCDVYGNPQLKFIQKQFLCSVPVHKIRWSNTLENITWEQQKILIDSTVDSELVLKYPVKISYQKSFLKFMVQSLEEQGTEIHDCVYSALGRLVAQSETIECFKHYLIEGGQIISLKENPNIISEGTTGLCSWQASFALSEWCLAHKTFLENKNIVELGSGVGLTGITVALICGPKKIHLTDCHSSVLQVLCGNVKLNVDNLETFNPNANQNSKNQTQRLLTRTVPSTKTTIEVLNLPWEDITEITCEYTKPDLLLAADVIYDSSLFPSLINAISCFLGCPNTKELIIACTERNKDTLGEFLSLLVIQGLNYRELDAIEPKYFSWSTECPIKIFSVTK